MVLDRERLVEFQININTEDGYATRYITGRINLEDMKAAYDAVFDHPDWRLEHNVLTVFDFDCQFGDITHEDVEALQSHMAARQAQRAGTPSVKSAIVFQNPVHMSIIALHVLGFADRVYGEERSFSNVQEALDWLREP